MGANDTPTESLIVAMSDGSRDEPARRDAAAMLAQRLVEPTAALALARALREDTPAGARVAAAEAIARVGGNPPREVVLAAGEALTATSDDTDEEPVALALISLLARSPSRDAVRVMLDRVLAPDSWASEALRAAAFDALTSQTGKSEFGSDLKQWRAWWSAAQWLPESEWRAEVAAWQTAEAARQRALARGASEELSAAYRRLYAMTPDEARGGLLVEMLGSPTAETRRTAFELVMVSLLNAKAVPAEVAAAAAGRLNDPIPGVRAQAARVVELLGRAGDATPLIVALEAETSAEPAAAMLRAASRAPSDRVVSAAARWLSTEGTAGAAAEEVLLAASRAGVSIPDDVALAVRTALASRAPASLSPTAVALLLSFGERARVEGLLLSPDERVALAAAQALGESAEGVDALLAAARTRAVLFAPAAAALERHRRSADGLAAIATLAASSDDARSAAERSLARLLPPRELRLAVASRATAAEREPLLTSVIDQQGFLVEGPEAGERVELALSLARTRLELGQPAAALALLDRFPSAWNGPRVVALRIASLACLNRVEDAWAITLSSTADQGPQPLGPWADGWLDGLEFSRMQPFAPEIAVVITQRFGPSLTESQRARLERLAAVMAAPTPQVAPAPAPQR
jgi:hypothetical protein